MMKHIPSAITVNRRELIKQVSMAALVSAMGSTGSGFALTRSDGVVPRIRESFDFSWKFYKADIPEAQNPEFSDANWKTVALPHDWSIEGPFGEKEPAGAAGGYLPTGVGWYRKRFHLPGSYKDKQLTIEFDGVYQNSEVWINGQYLGKRPYGYIPFSYDLTPHTNFEGENVIAVKVDNSHQTNCRWYSGSGIYRHTWLLSTYKVHVAHWGTFVTSPRVSRDEATLQIKTTIKNEARSSAYCTLTTNLLDAEGKAIQSAESSQEVAANGEYEFVQQMKMMNPHLWSVGDPYLYMVRSTVHKQNQVIDEYDTPIGIREAIFDADKGFLLNGERVKLNGVCLHHEAGCVGAAVPERVWQRRL